MVSERYEARPSDGDGYGWGVWDRFDGVWMSENRMKDAAEEGAEFLNKRQYAVSKPAEVWIDGEWAPARLVHWSHEPDGSWRGRAVLEGDRTPRWYPADRLRQMQRTPGRDDVTA